MQSISCGISPEAKFGHNSNITADSEGRMKGEKEREMPVVSASSEMQKLPRELLVDFYYCVSTGRVSPGHSKL